MALTQEQIQEIKKQLLEQIQHLPEAQRQEAEARINEMSQESIELLLKQQKGKSPGSPYRLIASKKISAVQIAGNPSAIAVLDINPISQGHTLIIPKKPAKSEKEIPKEAFELAKLIEEKILENLKAKSAKILAETKFNETIINLIPIYDKPLSLDSPRTSSSLDSLQLVAEKINKPKPELIKIEKPKTEIVKLKRRIP